MRITVNLATRSFTDLGPALKRLRIAMAALALAAIGLGLGLRALHHKADAARARDHSLDGEIARISRTRLGYLAMMRAPDNARMLAQVAALNQIFDEKAFSWTLAMENLETVLPGGVQVTAIEPIRDKDGHITLHLRVAGPHDLGDQMVENLEHSDRFFEPRIVGETAESSSGPNQHLEPVSASNRFAFDLLAEYNPPTPEEEQAAVKPSAAVPASAATPSGNANPRTSAANPPRGSRRILGRTSDRMPGPTSGRSSGFAPATGRMPYTGPSRPAPLPLRPPPARTASPRPGGMQ